MAAAERDRGKLARPLAALLVALAAAAILGSLIVGRAGTLPLDAVVASLRAIVGVGGAVSDFDRLRVELRLWEALTTAGVGATLALSGALLQGVFRNGLAAPSIIGVTGGASLGAAAAVLTLGGYVPVLATASASVGAPIAVAAASFLGALAATGVVMSLATSRGRISVPTLLLAGIAVNACCGGLLAAIQSVALDDYEISRAIFAWTFGSLEDKAPGQAALIWAAAAASLAVFPFVARELDLLAGGEEDAAALGVRVDRVKIVAVTAAALGAATSVAVAGQIAFVGLMVPHIVRQAVGSSHRAVLPLSWLAGAAFLVGAQLLQTALLGTSALRPGVLMSLVGGPFFILLLLRSKKDLRAW